jgi:flagellar biosynthesis chaperone FliJ
MDKKNPAAQNGLDPDLAELLDVAEAEPVADPTAEAGPDHVGGPDFHTLFSEEKPEPKLADGTDTTRQRFPTIIKILEEKPRPFFEDKDFYKKLLAGEGEEATRLHDLLGKFMKAEDPEEKSKFRAQLISAFWEVGSRIASRTGREMVIPKRLFLRFGILSPGFLTPELKDMVSRIVFENTSGEPVYYLDEWLERISKGLVRPSTVDEVKQKSRDTGQKVLDLAEKKKGQRDSEITLLKAKISQLDEREAQLRSQVDMLVRHERNEDYGLKACFSASQKAAMSQIQELLRQLSALDGQIASSYTELASLSKELENLGRKSEGLSAESMVDQKTVVNEYASIRQMAKMCVGRQGNHFPIFLSQFVRPNIREIATRENVIREMAQVEAMDPSLFHRTYKNQTTRIVPNIILVASCGDTGVCWEPFEKYNRATSRGRVAIPMFPKSLPVAVLTAMADLRWQVAKEKAQYYWMEEGITGKYYQWFTERKLRGDVREYFIRDYALWINKESQGMQKLDKEIRGIFWRMMPFPQHIKDNLKNRSFVYGELYKKDQNIARSDGY